MVTQGWEALGRTGLTGAERLGVLLEGSLRGAENRHLSVARGVGTTTGRGHGAWARARACPRARYGFEDLPPKSGKLPRQRCLNRFFSPGTDRFLSQDTCYPLPPPRTWIPLGLGPLRKSKEPSKGGGLGPWTSVTTPYLDFWPGPEVLQKPREQERPSTSSSGLAHCSFCGACSTFAMAHAHGQGLP